MTFIVSLTGNIENNQYNTYDQNNVEIFNIYLNQNVNLVANYNNTQSIVYKWFFIDSSNIETNTNVISNNFSIGSGNTYNFDSTNFILNKKLRVYAYANLSDTVSLGYVDKIINIIPKVTSNILTICSGEKVILSIPGVVNNATYQWQKFETTWVDILNATDIKYESDGLNLNTQFRLKLVLNNISYNSNLIQIRVIDKPTVSYIETNYTFIKNVLIDNIVPSSTNAINFSISPEFPLNSGLNFNTSNGTISGTPNVAFDVTTYTITANNNNANSNNGISCSSTTSITINVLDYIKDVVVSEFVLKGSATPPVNNIFTITPNIVDQIGMIYNINQIDLNMDFYLDIDIAFTYSVNSTADGMAFILSPLLKDYNITVGGGSGLGYKTLSPSFAVEFDIYPTSGEPLGNNNLGYHIALTSNGNTSTYNDHYKYSPAYTSAMNNFNMKDGLFHNVKIIWTKTNKNFRVLYENKVIHNKIIDLNTILTNNIIYWGFTGATGGISSEQRVRINKYSNNIVPTIEYIPQNNIDYIDNKIILCYGNNVVLKAPTSTSYSWYKDNLLISNSTNQNLTVTQAGFYSVITNPPNNLNPSQVIIKPFTANLKTTIGSIINTYDYLTNSSQTLQTTVGSNINLEYSFNLINNYIFKINGNIVTDSIINNNKIIYNINNIQTNTIIELTFDYDEYCKYVFVLTINI